MSSVLLKISKGGDMIVEINVNFNLNLNAQNPTIQTVVVQANDAPVSKPDEPLEGEPRPDERLMPTFFRATLKKILQKIFFKDDVNK